MVDTSGAYINSEEKPKKERKPRLLPDAPDVTWDDSKENFNYIAEAVHNHNQTNHNLKLSKLISPSDLNIKLRLLYQIPLSVNRNHIQPYLNKIENENHKYFLKRYAINGKEFDVCWLLLQEGI
jgi:hypothetical protein